MYFYGNVERAYYNVEKKCYHHPQLTTYQLEPGMEQMFLGRYRLGILLIFEEQSAK